VIRKPLKKIGRQTNATGEAPIPPGLTDGGTEPEYGEDIEYIAAYHVTQCNYESDDKQND
jgi:hypothetical protein